jgi:hypothetical protein
MGIGLLKDISYWVEYSGFRKGFPMKIKLSEYTSRGNGLI